MSHNITIEGGTSLRLKTAGKYCDRDIVVTSSGGTENLEAVLNEQEALIAELKETLNGKATGGGEPIIEPLEVTENGEYTPPDGVDGYAPVVVNVPTGGGSSEEEWIGDGNTHIWISLAEGRTSPMLCIGVNGTVTVDWGDGSTPDTLTGTNILAQCWTPAHEYEKPGNYVITLAGGEIGLLGDSTLYSRLLRADKTGYRKDFAYVNSIKRFECGSNVVKINTYAFYNCHSLSSVHNVLAGRTSATYCMFWNCYSLSGVLIPDGVTVIDGQAFRDCYALSSVRLPSSVVTIGSQSFYNCYGVAYFDFSQHTAVPTLSSTNAFTNISDFRIRVPAALVDEWKAASNWSTYASKIVGV